MGSYLPLRLPSVEVQQSYEENVQDRKAYQDETCEHRAFFKMIKLITPYYQDSQKECKDKKKDAFGMDEPFRI
jgi:hypothetical protein